MTPGLALLGVLAALVAAALIALASAAPAAGTLTENLPYIARIIAFTAVQAGLSTILSLGFGAMLALALARRRFPGRSLVLALLGAATALPAIVVVFAVTAIYGRSGIVNDAIAMLGLPRFSIYGLSGILLAHVFLNAAFATRVFLVAVEAVPGEHWRVAASLGMTPLAILRLIDVPVLRREMPALAILTFIVCATSFAIPLALGGGPGAATLEVAIFEALRFDADFGLTAQLAMIQIGIMAILVLLSIPWLVRLPETGAEGRVVPRPDSAALWPRLIDAGVLAAAALLVLPPLCAIAVSGRSILSSLDARTAWALATSLAVALPAAALALVAALVLNRTRTVAMSGGWRRLGALVAVAPLLTIAVPPLAFAAGLYVLARSFGDPSAIALPALVLVNAMMAMPFVHRFVEPPLTLAAERYGRLADSLGMSFFARLRFVEWPLLAGPAAAGFAYAAALSLGDLGVVTLFGAQGVMTLPALLYEKLGAYRIGEAEGVAALLSALVLVLFLSADRLARGHARPR